MLKPSEQVVLPADVSGESDKSNSVKERKLWTFAVAE